MAIAGTVLPAGVTHCTQYRKLTHRTQYRTYCTQLLCAVLCPLGNCTYCTNLLYPATVPNLLYPATVSTVPRSNDRRPKDETLRVRRGSGASARAGRAHEGCSFGCCCDSWRQQGCSRCHSTGHRSSAADTDDVPSERGQRAAARTQGRAAQFSRPGSQLPWAMPHCCPPIPAGTATLLPGCTSPLAAPMPLIVLDLARDIVGPYSVMSASCL